MFKSCTSRRSAAWTAVALTFLVVPALLAQKPKGRAAVVAASASAAPAYQPEPPVSPARVILQNGLLTVEAHNSELNDVLQEVARLTGMSISGLNRGRRIYGVYGPAEPRAVLTVLLTASGYNFLMVGGDATPREIVLTPETKAPPTMAKAEKPKETDDYYADYVEQQDSPDPY